MDIPTATCPPELAEKIKHDLPALAHIVSHVPLKEGLEAHQKHIGNAADEMRRAFPHLDDLTLAAICTMNAHLAQNDYIDSPTVRNLSRICSHAEMAIALAWELTGEL